MKSQIDDLYEWLSRIDPILGFLAFLVLLGSGIVWILRPRGKLWILTQLSRLSPFFDKSTIGQQCVVFMQPRINALNQENPEATLPAAKIQFTKIRSKSTQLENGKVFIVLKESKNRAQNLLRIATEYVSQGVMYGSRRIVDDNIRRSVSVVLVYRLLQNMDDALRLWDTEVYQPCLNSDLLKDTLEKLAHMDQTGGYLTRIYLPQLELVARRVGLTINPRLTSESKEWLDIVYNISLKHHDDPDVFNKEHGPLVLRLPNIAVGFVLVAKSWIISRYDTKYHEGWIVRHLNDAKVKEVYIIGWTEENCYHAIKMLGNTYLREDIAEIWPTLYRIKSRGQENIPVVLIRYIKGQTRDELQIRETVHKFQKTARKELKRMFVTPNKVMHWFQKNGLRYLGAERKMIKSDYDAIAKIIDNDGMTIEVLDFVFEDDYIQSRLQDMTKSLKLSNLPPKDEVLYRIYVAMGYDDNEIFPRLDPMLFLNE